MPRKTRRLDSRNICKEAPVRKILSFLLPVLTLAAAAVPAAAPAAAKDRLTIYTYESFTSEWGPGPAVKKSFEAECGCEVDFVSVPTAWHCSTASGWRAPPPRRSRAGPRHNLTAEAKATGYSRLRASTGRGQRARRLERRTFVPYDYGYFAVVYDTEKLKQRREPQGAGGRRPGEKIAIQDRAPPRPASACFWG